MVDKTILTKRGTEANRTSFTPAQGQLVYTTDEKRVWIGDGSTAGGTFVGPDANFHPGQAAGRRYHNANNLLAPTSTSLSSNILVFAPFCVGQLVTFDRIGMSIASAGAGTNFRCGLYSNNRGIPGSLLIDSGTLSAASTGFVEATISTTLRPGWYWTAAVADSATPAFHAHNAAGSANLIGHGSTTAVTIPTLFFQIHVFGALPSTAAIIGDSGGNSPIVQFRAA